jgi:hypothetical protein
MLKMYDPSACFSVSEPCSRRPTKGWGHGLSPGLLTGLSATFTKSMIGLQSYKLPNCIEGLTTGTWVGFLGSLSTKNSDKIIVFCKDGKGSDSSPFS